MYYFFRQIQQMKKEATREKIHNAAKQCFIRYGLDKTTLEDIAKAVGLNKASLYYYFKSKEDIFLEVAIGEGEGFLNMLQAQTLQKEGTEKRVWFYMQERINYYRNVLNVNRVSVDTLNKILPRYFELFEIVQNKEIKFLSNLIKEGIKAGELNKINTDKLASALITMSDALKHSLEQETALRKEAEVDYSRCLSEIKLIVSLIFKGLSCREA